MFKASILESIEALTPVTLNKSATCAELDTNDGLLIMLLNSTEPDTICPPLPTITVPDVPASNVISAVFSNT